MFVGEQVKDVISIMGEEVLIYTLYCFAEYELWTHDEPHEM